MTPKRPHAILLPGIAAMLLMTAGCTPAARDEAIVNPPPQTPIDSGPRPAPASTDPDLDRARAAATRFSGRLRGTLQAAMQNGGPIAAIEVCHTEAPRIAEAVMAEYEVRLGRVALPARNRNPAQAADGWKLATLTAFQQAVADGAPAADQVFVSRDNLPDGMALRMMRGIATEPGCLACHGKEVAEPVRAAIAEHYPDDHATGFDVGDLRGALWVEVPATVNRAGLAP